MNILLVVGHSEMHKGAEHNSIKDLNEFNLNNKFVDKIMKCYGANPNGNKKDIRNSIYKMLRPNTKDINKGLILLVNKINKMSFDLVIEFHSNFFNNGLAKGNETLYYANSKKAKKIAVELNQITAKILNNTINNRGIKPRDNKQYKARGSYLITHLKPTTLIYEPMFINNDYDVANFLFNQDELAFNISNWLKGL